MANLILTEKCNKGCSYCFAKGANFDGAEMSFELAQQLIDDAIRSNERIKLLGGEPTIAKNFKKIVDYLVFKDVGFTIISNLLFSEDILSFLVSRYNYNKKFSILANSTDLDISNRFEIFKRNYHEMTKLGVPITLGFTIDRNKSASYHKKYVQRVLKEFNPSGIVRLSLQFPTSDSQYNPIHNYKYGNKIYQVCKILYKLNVRGRFDCTLIPCLFRKYQFRFIASYFQFRLECTGAPLDISPDRKVIHCYPFNKCSTTYTNINNDRRLLLDKYQSDRKLYSKECLSCKFYKLKLCTGPCSAFIGPN